MGEHIELLVGVFLIVMGASVVLQSQFWIEYAKRLITDPSHIVPLAFMTLLFGLVVLFFHSEWTKSAKSLVTLMGWIMTVKGSLLFLLPKQMVKIYPVQLISPRFLKVEGTLMVVLGVVIVLFAFT